MGNDFNKIVGRYIRLKNAAFQKIEGSVSRRGSLENLFVVAAVTRGMNKLVCYGGSMRITVSVYDVVVV